MLSVLGFEAICFLEGLALSILRTGVSLQHEGLRLDLRGTFLAVK